MQEVQELQELHFYFYRKVKLDMNKSTYAGSAGIAGIAFLFL
jgi:hypothetical protein